MALSVECRTCDQEVVGSSLGRAYALQMGSKGRYGSCVGDR